MEALGAILAAIVNLFKTPITIYGFTFSFWNIFFWTWIGSLILWAIFKFLDN